MSNQRKAGRGLFLWDLLDCREWMDRKCLVFLSSVVRCVAVSQNQTEPQRFSVTSASWTAECTSVLMFWPCPCSTVLWIHAVIMLLCTFGLLDKFLWDKFKINIFAIITVLSLLFCWCRPERYLNIIIFLACLWNHSLFSVWSQNISWCINDVNFVCRWKMRMFYWMNWSTVTHEAWHLFYFPLCYQNRELVKVTRVVPESSGDSSSELRSGAVTSLVVKAGGDFEDVGRAFVRRDNGSQVLSLFGVSKVFDPVGAAGGWQRNVPLDCGVALLLRTFQPVKPAARHST